MDFTPHNNPWPTALGRRRASLKTVVGAIVAVAAITAGTVARYVWAAEPQQRTAAAPVTHPTISKAEVNARTAPLANLEDAFIAIGDRLEPSVVSIRVNKTVRTAGMQNM